MSFGASGSQGFTYSQTSRSSYTGQMSGHDLSTVTASGQGDYAAAGQGSFAQGSLSLSSFTLSGGSTGAYDWQDSGAVGTVGYFHSDVWNESERSPRPARTASAPRRPARTLEGTGLELRQLHANDRGDRDGGGLGGGRGGVGRGQRHDRGDGLGHVGREHRDGLGLVHLDGQFDPAARNYYLPAHDRRGHGRDADGAAAAALRGGPHQLDARPPARASGRRLRT